jgi:hypothetical protein
MQYRLAAIAAIDWTVEKIQEGWSKEDAKQYGNMKLDSLGVTYPNRCTYCYVRALMK